MENKKDIVVRLKLLLSATRCGENVADLVLSEDERFVTIAFKAGGNRRVCVEGDSGYAIIRDVMNAI